MIWHHFSLRKRLYPPYINYWNTGIAPRKFIINISVISLVFFFHIYLCAWALPFWNLFSSCVIIIFIIGYFELILYFLCSTGIGKLLRIPDFFIRSKYSSRPRFAISLSSLPVITAPWSSVDENWEGDDMCVCVCVCSTALFVCYHCTLSFLHNLFL